MLHSCVNPWQTRAVKPLEPPDSLHLEAAEGWLELGNHVEANEELEKITPQLRVHPDVLELRWQIHAAANQWEAALNIAAALVQLAPDDPVGPPTDPNCHRLPYGFRSE